MDRLDELTLFLTVLDSGTMAAAGRRLHRSPPSVSRILARLEHRLGARLVDRTTRRLAPTAFGVAFAAQARDLVAHYETLTRTAANEADQPSGLLRITAPVVCGRRHIAPLLAGFLRRFDQIQATLTLSDRNLDLIEDGLDVAVRIGNMADSTLVARKVATVRQILVASPDYLARHGLPRVVRDLSGHAIIAVESRPMPYEWRFARNARGHEQVVRFTPRIVANDMGAGIAMAVAGLGIMRALSYQVTDEITAASLVRLLPHDEPPACPVQLVTTGQAFRPARVQAFLDYATPALARRLQGPDKPQPDGIPHGKDTLAPLKC